MKESAVPALALAIGLAFSGGVMAQAMTRNQHQGRQTAIGAQYQQSLAACGAVSAKDRCRAEARGAEQVATAELNAKFAPSEAASYKVRVTRAEAAYALAVTQCAELAGPTKDVCIKEARSHAVSAKANAKAHMKTALAHDAAFEKASKAQAVADEKAAQAQNKADQKSAAARTDAAAEMRAAAYAVAKERCDALSGDAEGHCIKDVTAHFGKP